MRNTTRSRSVYGSSWQDIDYTGRRYRGRGWQDVLKEHGPDELAAHFVKISHHGSTTGYCSGLWPTLCGQKKRKPIAALTPYKRFGLPDPEALDHIKEYVGEIHSASHTGHAERTENWRIKAIGKLKAAQTGRVQVQSSAPGCCEIEANDQGDCRVILHSPACTLFRGRGPNTRAVPSRRGSSGRWVLFACLFVDPDH